VKLRNFDIQNRIAELSYMELYIGEARLGYYAELGFCRRP